MNNKIPTIILHKIYWYLWRINQRNLCLEYYNEIIKDKWSFYSDMSNYILFKSQAYNWRKSDCYTSLIRYKCNHIHNKEGILVAKLPKNYDPNQLYIF